MGLPLYDHSLLDMLGFGAEQNVRYGWFKNRDKNRWVPLGQRQNKTLGSRDEFLEQVSAEANDIFISPNEFFSWRNKKQVSKLHANYIDIDTVDRKKLLTLEEENALINDVFMQLLEAGIPYPSGMVRSGSGGIHLYWIYTPVEAYKYRVAVWEEISNKIAEVLDGGDLWQVDMKASCDSTRVMRMPGSVHGKSKREVIDEVITPELYQFDDLVRSFGLEKMAQQPVYFDGAKKKDKVESKPEVKERRRNQGKHNIRQWWLTTYFHVVKRGRSAGFNEGRRDSAAFILFVALRHIKDSVEDAYQAVSALNDEFIHLTDAELRSYLESAMSIKYKYSKEKLAKYLSDSLGMDTSFLFQQAKARLSLNELKQRWRAGAKHTAKIKRESTLERISNVYRAGMTQSAVATMVNLSARTVRRYWQDVLRDCMGH